MQPRINNPAIIVPGAMEAMQQLAGLGLAIASINAWNRVSAATRQVAGEWISRWIGQAEPAHQAA